jgi:hypothetical protein
LIENDFGCGTRVRAAENDGERPLSFGQFGAPGRTLIWMREFAGDKTGVARFEAREGGIGTDAGLMIGGEGAVRN